MDETMLIVRWPTLAWAQVADAFASAIFKQWMATVSRKPAAIFAHQDTSVGVSVLTVGT
jgi:hypothetical protein